MEGLRFELEAQRGVEKVSSWIPRRNERLEDRSTKCRYHSTHNPFRPDFHIQPPIPDLLPIKGQRGGVQTSPNPQNHIDVCATLHWRCCYETCTPKSRKNRKMKLPSYKIPPFDGCNCTENGGKEWIKHEIDFGRPLEQSSQ